MKHTYLAATSAAALMALAAVVPAQAQQQSAEGRVALEEIVVTARKVEENLMTVPLAITAFSSNEIESMGLKQMNDISQFTPSFHFVNQVGGGSGRNDRSINSLTFRGLYLGNNSGTTAGGQLFIDGTPVIGAQGPAVTDVERVEVLKGPQSAYFGRSTFVGAINYVTRDPSNTFKGRVSAEYASYGSNEETASLEGPIVEDKLAARISGRHWHRGGQYTNAADASQTFGAQTTNSVAATFVFKPTDAVKVKAFANYFEDNDGPPAQAALKQSEFNCSYNVPATLANANRPSGGYYCGAIPDVNQLNPKIISGDYTLTPYLYDRLINNTTNKPVIFDPHFENKMGFRRKGFQADARIDYEASNGYTFSSTTAYHRDKGMSVLDLNFRDSHDRPNPFAAIIPGVLPYQDFDLVAQFLTRDWSEELRVTSDQKSRFRWTFGGNYLDVYSPGGSVYGNSPVGVIFAAAITRQYVKTPAVFGGAYYDLMPDLTLSAEARYQWDKVKQVPYIGVSGAQVTGVGAQPLSNTFKSFSPRVSIDYKYMPDSTAYILWSRGYRPGAFNSVLVTSAQSIVDFIKQQIPNVDVAYKEEKLDNFEAGVKSTWLDGRARTQIAVYYDKWTNGQVSNAIPLPQTTNLVSVTVNTGRADLKGVEAEGQFQATKNLKFAATLGLNDTSVKSYVCSDCNYIYGTFDATGHKLPGSPKWTWTGSAEYSDDLAGDYKWFGRVDYTHQGRYYVDFSNVAWTHSQNIVNLRAGIRNQSITIEAFVTNLTQDTTPPGAQLGVDVFTFLIPPNRNEIRYSLPVKRMFGARASYNF